MRATAFLFAIVISILMVQPAFTNYGNKEVSSSCTKNRQVKKTCSRAKPIKRSCTTNKKCSKPENPKSKKNCSKEHCNPLLGCPSGNFYLMSYSTVSLSSFSLPKQKMILVDDNRIAKQLTECFHPPEII